MIRWGIIGLGNMANNFAKSIKEIESCELKAVSSLNKNRLNEFSNNYQVDNKYKFNSYLELINCDEIDAIYISTLNNTHANLIIDSINKNKNVLCEKPITISRDELKTVVNKINNSDVSFLEAIAYRSHPLTKIIEEILKNTKIGKIRKIITNFGFDTKRINPKSRLYNKSLGGGAILDIGCYPLSAINLIKNIIDYKEKITFKEVKGNVCETGVDDYSLAHLKLGNDIKAVIEVGIRKKLKNQIHIITTDGEILIPESWLPNKKTYIEVKMKDHCYKKFINCKYSVYANQIHFFNYMIKNKTKTPKSPYLSINDSQEIAELSLEWRKKLHSIIK
jgi:predicted dehydrogenase